MPYIIGNTSDVNTDTYLKEYYGLIDKTGTIKQCENLMYKNDVVSQSNEILIQNGNKINIKMEIMSI